MITSESLDERVLILAPAGGDGELASGILSEAGIVAVMCSDVDRLRAEIRDGVGAVLLTEEVLSPPTIETLVEILGSQLPWSDLPLLVFAGEPESSRRAGSPVRKLAAVADITVFDRPTRKLTLISAMRAALRARRRQYEVRDLLLRLERGVRQRDHFLAILGHELRNPLAAILTSTQLMELDRNEDLAVARRVIRRQAEVLTRLVDDLLDVSRLTTGKIALNRVPVDIAELAESCVRSFQPSAASRGIDLEMARDGKPFVVSGDPIRLEQVVNNLLSNALKYTPAGGAVRVSVRASERFGEVEVSDSGVGISATDLARIFEPFTQADSSIERSLGGLGIGLTLVRRLAALHGGTISASSAGRGRGSAFVLRLPRLALSAPPDRPTLLRPVRGAAPSRRILIIEDNADVRDGLRRLLQEEGHEVTTAGDGDEGVRVALKGRPEVVLVDIGLPKLDGYGVATRVRKELPEQPLLVAVTGYGSREDRTRALTAGFDLHMTKPVTLDAILDLLARVKPRAPSPPGR